MSTQPKAPFWLAVWAVIFGLVGLAAWRGGMLEQFGLGRPGAAGQRPMAAGGGAGGPAGAGTGAGADGAAGAEGMTEAPDVSVPTTVKEYTFKPAEKLPPVKGVSAYKPLEDETVKFALNVWAGWAPIIRANNGFKAGKLWQAPGCKPFKVELVLIDDPVQMRDAYAAGEVHIGWATLDMLPLFVDSFAKDSRIMPRVYQQVDFSNGGDGIVVRDTVKTVRDLAGKKLVLAQNSPSQFFALNMLVAGGLQPADVEMVFTSTAFEAAAAFNRDKSIAGCVSWAPDIYNLADAKGNRMLVTTQTANRLIADIWFARADFAKDHPDKIEAIARGIFDAMQELKGEGARKKVADLMASGYAIPADDAIKMLGDAHSTNWAENYQFFLNRNNPANFEQLWKQAYYLYRKVGAISNSPVPFDQVMDFSVIQKLGQEPKYAETKDEYVSALPPKSVREIRAESEEILTNTIRIQFYPNSWDVHFKRRNRQPDGTVVEELYDPKVDAVLQEVARLASQMGNARVIVEGHTDASMKGRVPVQDVRELSLNRAKAVRDSLVKQFELEPARFAVDGLGWDRPADDDHPDNDQLNRRVEIKIYTPEKE
jgi:ABC-type nitrate/sulfonate/bicarbonate transport system substrate-binding protein